MILNILELIDMDYHFVRRAYIQRHYQAFVFNWLKLLKGQILSFASSDIFVGFPAEEIRQV